MTRPALRTDILGNRWLTFALRLGLGTSFLVFGASKLADLDGFADTVISYHVLPESLARAYGLGLPFAEVLIGVCLILGLGLRLVAPVAILVIASLIAGTSANLFSAETDVQKCGCLGGADWPLGPSHLVGQVVMLIMATQIWLHKGDVLRLDSRLFKRSGERTLISSGNKTE